MMKTVLYISQNTKLLLQQPDINHWFPENRQHPVELARNFDEILGCVVATHSQPLINLIGHKIASGELHNTDFEVRIIWSENDIQVCWYNTEGYLQNWSLGFFNLPL